MKILLTSLLGIIVGLCVSLLVIWYINRPLTCEMGKMLNCPGGGVQFCQYDHYTSCYELKIRPGWSEHRTWKDGNP